MDLAHLSPRRQNIPRFAYPIGAGSNPACWWACLIQYPSRVTVMVIMDKPVVPFTCLLAPMTQHLNKFKSSEPLGVERHPERVSRLEAGTVAIFLFAQNYSRAGSAIDICVTT